MSNISKKHREDLLNKIQQIRTFIASAPQDANTNNLLQYLDELTKDVKGKKYGLVFEQHREQIDEILDTHTPVLTEQKDLFIDNGGEMNFLIEGDNLAALQLLEKTHKGKIDVIYIDPPYNTGAKDWKYNNDYVDGNDTFRHSKWLSMMKVRLEKAKDLLSIKGIIICAIDHYELFTLGSLMDEVFGEENRIGICAVVHKPEGRNQEKFFGTSHEYALFYAYNKEQAEFNKIVIDEDLKIKFDLLDDKGSYKRKNFIRMADGKYATREAKPNFWYPIYVSKDMKSFSLNHKDDWYEIYPIIKSGVERTWKTLPKTFSELVKNNSIEAEMVNGRVEIYEKLREDQVIKTHWIKKEYHGYHFGAKILNEIIGEKIFDFPKSLYLIKDFLSITSKPFSTILDFFAGSGTTGHAVMKLNAEDGGHRRFILCTNNENNICRDVTYERLRTVITGKRKDGSEYNEHYDASLKYYKIDFVPISDKLYYEYADELLLHIRELVELENGINFNGNNDIAIVLTDDEMEQFVADDNQAKVLYRGHDVLLTAEQENYIKAKGIKVNVIPDYYYNELNR